MKIIDHAKTIYTICVEYALRGSSVTYREILDRLGCSHGVGGLDLIMLACAHSHLPNLASIVVNRITDCQSTGGGSPFDLMTEDIQAVFENKNWPDIEEIDWTIIWENRSELSDLAGTLYKGKIIYSEKQRENESSKPQGKNNVRRVRPVISYLNDSDEDNGDDDPSGGAAAMRA
jgi:hypothetical protein